MAFESVNNTRYQGSTSDISTSPVPATATTANSAGTDAVTEVDDSEDKDKLGSTQKQGEKSWDTISQTEKDYIKKQLSKMNRNIECIFGIHEETNLLMIKVVDRDTKEVIKEIPPEKSLDILAKIWESAGLLVDEKL